MIFDGIEEALKNDGKSLVNKVKGIFAFKVKKPDGKTLDIIYSHTSDYNIVEYRIFKHCIAITFQEK